MVPLYPPFTSQSNLGYVFNGHESLYTQSQENQEDIITSVDQFCLTFGVNDCFSQQQQQQPLPLNIDQYYCSDIQLNNNNIAAYNPTVFPSAPTGGNQLSLPLQPVSNTGTAVGPEDAMEAEKRKRLDHNASERDRRKKLNCLYSSLRSIMPIIDKKKKLSNPSTVAWALKYIPELQKNVELLSQRKQELLSSISKPQNNTTSETKSRYSVQATQLGNKEISIQISAIKSANNVISIIPVSEILRELEEENGHIIMEVSSSESSYGRIFHNLHLKVKEVESESLREKILCMFQKWESFTTPDFDELKSFDLHVILYD